MFSGSELAKLEETMRRLIAEADRHRNALKTEAAGWGSRLARLQSWRESVSGYRPLAVALAAGAGLLAARRGRSLFRWIPIGLSVWRTVREFLPRKRE